MVVDRAFFYEIGAFDADMEIWGGENLEIALRVYNSPTICKKTRTIQVKSIFAGLAMRWIIINDTMLSHWSFISHFNVFVWW